VAIARTTVDAQARETLPAQGLDGAFSQLLRLPTEAEAISEASLFNNNYHATLIRIFTLVKSAWHEQGQRHRARIA